MDVWRLTGRIAVGPGLPYWRWFPPAPEWVILGNNPSVKFVQNNGHLTHDVDSPPLLSFPIWFLSSVSFRRFMGRLPRCQLTRLTNRIIPFEQISFQPYQRLIIRFKLTSGSNAEILSFIYHQMAEGNQISPEFLSRFPRLRGGSFLLLIDSWQFDAVRFFFRFDLERFYDFAVENWSSRSQYTPSSLEAARRCWRLYCAWCFVYHIVCFFIVWCLLFGFGCVFVFVRFKTHRAWRSLFHFRCLNLPRLSYKKNRVSGWTESEKLFSQILTRFEFISMNGLDDFQLFQNGDNFVLQFLNTNYLKQQ